MMKFVKTIFIILVAVISLHTKAYSQDASFSQNYASPLYLSPSFTGLVDGSRVVLNYRDQWPAIPNTYRTYSVSVDHYFSDFNSGIGFLYYRDDQGKGALVDQNFGASYAYEIYVSDKIMIRPGILFKFAQSFIDPTKGTLGVGIGPDGSSVSGGNVVVAQDKTNKFDAASSIMIYSSLYWGGVTLDHLVKSNIGFTDIETNRGIKLTAFGGYKWIYKEARRGNPNQSVTFAFNYRKQQSFNQLDIGAYWLYTPIELGLWYRGYPSENSEGFRNTDAVIAILGIHTGSLRFGYSFDLTISDLAGNTGGTHEFSIMYSIPSSNKPRINRGALPCSQPGYSGGGPSRSKYRSRGRRMF